MRGWQGRSGHRGLLAILMVMLPLAGTLPVTAQVADPDAPAGVSTPTGPLGIQLRVDGGDDAETLSTSIRILLLMTALSLAPSALIMLTGFTRIMIVLGILRRAIGLQSAPPNQLLAGLALFLTFFVMRPMFVEMHDQAWIPLREGAIGDTEAWERASEPVRRFMLGQVGEPELRLFYDLSGEPIPDAPDAVNMIVLVPAFMVSELKTAFQMGFLIWLPFLIIDLVLASSLMALGMMMLPPMMISLPIKVLFFVLADGWTLVIQGLVESFL